MFLCIRNFAELDEPGSPELANVVLPMPWEDALKHIAQVATTIPLWHVESINSTEGTIHLTRRTRLFRFVDDIRLRVEAVNGSTRLHGRSQSRVGKSDFGQNRRNLRTLIAALRR